MRNEKGAEYRSDRVICHMCWNSGFFVVEFKKHREVCTGNNTGSSAEPMSEQSVSDSDVSGNSAENSADLTELPEKEESEPVETEDPSRAEDRRTPGRNDLRGKVGQMFIARCPETMQHPR